MHSQCRVRICMCLAHSAVTALCCIGYAETHNWFLASAVVDDLTRSSQAMVLVKQVRSAHVQVSLVQQ